MPSNRDKRASERVQARLPLYVVQGDDGFRAEAVDLSLTGIHVASHRRPLLNDMCEIQVMVAKRPIYLRAQVTRLTEDGFAVSGFLIDPEAHRRLRRLVRSFEAQAA